MGERVRERHEHRVDALEQADIIAALRLALGHADQTDLVAERGGLADIGGHDMPDAGDVDLGEIDLRAKGEAGQDGELVRGVDAVNVKRGIGLGIALGLRLGENGAKGTAILLHGGEDVIAGAVEDAIDAHDAIGRSAFAQSLDHGHAAGHCRFIFQRDAGALCFAGEIKAMMRNHRLVGRDEGLALAEALAGKGEGRAIRSTDQLDDSVDIRAGRERTHVVDPLIAREVDATILAPVPSGNGDDLDWPAGATGDQIAIDLQQANDAGAHRAEANDGEAEGSGLGHEAILVARRRAARSAALIERFCAWRKGRASGESVCAAQKIGLAVRSQGERAARNAA